MNVVLQSVLYTDEVCKEKEIFYRSSGNVKLENDYLILEKNAAIITDTYMNIFDAALWKRYTPITTLKLEMKVRGRGCIRIYSWSKAGRKLLSESEINSGRLVKRIFYLTEAAGMLFFEVVAKGDFELRDVYYIAEVDEVQVNPVNLSLIICTYRRNEQLMKNVDKLRHSLFFDELSVLYHGLSVRIVDNASDFSEIREGYIKLYHNKNTGGSGGFIRGIIESRKDEKEYGITHVIFMDDDVEISMEAFYRVYALLQLIRPDYENEMIGGRMFRLDKRKIQYTASEIWNQGDIIHVGHNRDMTCSEEVLNMNDKTGEYSGWWFACFPMRFIRDHLPLPFFLHCDDVEYGLRHGGRPIVLNGIQVWHETYEYRQSPMITYYDIRNSLIVNILYDFFKNEKDVWNFWKRKMDSFYMDMNYEKIYATILALNDYMRGRKWFLRGKKKNIIVLPRSKLSELYLGVMWRMMAVKYRCLGRRMFFQYKCIVR